ELPGVQRAERERHHDGQPADRRTIRPGDRHRVGARGALWRCVQLLTKERGMTIRVCVAAAVAALLFAPASFADPLTCDVSQYKAGAGLTATVDQNLVAVSWAGQGGAELRARYAIDGGQPVVRDLAIRKAGGQWTTLGQNLAAEYRVVTGV